MSNNPTQTEHVESNSPSTDGFRGLIIALIAAVVSFALYYVLPYDSINEESIAQFPTQHHL